MSRLGERWRVVVAVVGLLVSSAACSEGERAESAANPSNGGATANTSATPRADPSPRLVVTNAQLDRAVRQIIEDDTGSYETSIEIGPTRIDKLGRYRLSTLGSSQTMTAPSERGGTTTVRSVTENQVAYVNFSIPDGPSNRCWLSLTEEALKSALPGQFVSDVPIGIPAELAVLSTVRSKRGVVTSDIRNVAAAFGNRLALAFGNRPGRTEIDLEMREGTIVGWSTPLNRLLADAFAAGVKKSTELKGLRRARARITVSFERFGEPLQITPPSENLQINIDPSMSDAEVGEAFAACPG